MAWACLIVPSSDPADVVTGSKGDWDLLAYQGCKALAEYRQGRFASAAEWALKALSQPEYATVFETKESDS